MGGCRCTFRDCNTNSQKFPNMSFFHYPVNKKERLEKWLKYSKFTNFHKLDPSQAKNRSVCALHFRDECFMNYKKNRLTATAIPTLDRLKSGQVLDYMLDDNPKPIDYPPTKEEHLIIPEGTTVWGHLPEFWTTYSTVPQPNTLNPESLEPKSKRPRIREISKIANSINEPKILNQRLLHNVSLNENFDINETSISFSDEDHATADNTVDLDSCNMDYVPASPVNNHVETEDNNSDTVIDLDDVEYLSVEQIEPVEETVSYSTYKASCNFYRREITELRKTIRTQERENEIIIAELKSELEQTKKNLKKSESISTLLKLKAVELKKKVGDLETKNQELLEKKSEPPLVVASPIVQPTPPPTPTPAPSPSNPPSKAQLFNGLKKYLSASMTALVRMEMFGNSERPWKPDEKQVSVELLKLGEQVYKYFTDEWRFRLPPKKMVEDWSLEVNQEDTEDL